MSKIKGLIYLFGIIILVMQIATVAVAEWVRYEEDFESYELGTEISPWVAYDESELVTDASIVDDGGNKKLKVGRGVGSGYPLACLDIDAIGGGNLVDVILDLKVKPVAGADEGYYWCVGISIPFSIL